jgi:uncharacterized repeat protein (TIGR03803 family)
MKISRPVILGITAALAVLTACSGGASQSQLLGLGQQNPGSSRLGAKTSARLPTSARRQLATEKVLYAFNSSGPYNPVASVISDASGALYGTLQDGGVKTGFCYYIAGCGGVFKLTPNGSGYTESVLYEFTGGSDGAGPFGNLYMDSSGALYGTAAYAGSTTCGLTLGCGTVFKLVPSGSTYTESTLYKFKGGTDGASPVAGLIANQTGALYGTTQAGGDAAGDGSVFKLTASGREHILHRFHGCSIPSKGCDGANPSAPLYMNSAGDLFGTTTYGGAYSCPLGNLCGTAFELKHSGTRYIERVIHNFKGNSDGANSQGALIADAQGALYGATVLGGGASQQACNFGSVVRGCGTVFKLTPVSKGYHEVVLYAFQGGLDGAAPQAGVIMDSSGALYGTTQLGGYCGGCGGYGTVFKLASAGSGYTESVAFAFICSPSLCTGQAPRAGLIEINGTFYGTTFQGGGGLGEVFSLTP